jgi:hypothetical protein
MGTVLCAHCCEPICCAHCQRGCCGHVQSERPRRAGDTKLGCTIGTRTNEDKSWQAFLPGTASNPTLVFDSFETCCQADLVMPGIVFKP